MDRHSKKTTLLEWVLWIINCTTKVSTRNNLHPCKLSQWFSLFQRSSKSLLDQLIAWHFIWAVQWVCRNELLYTTYLHVKWTVNWSLLSISLYLVYIMPNLSLIRYWHETEVGTYEYSVNILPKYKLAWPFGLQRT